MFVYMCEDLLADVFLALLVDLLLDAPLDLLRIGLLVVLLICL